MQRVLHNLELQYTQFGLPCEGTLEHEMNDLGKVGICNDINEYVVLKTQEDHSN